MQCKVCGNEMFAERVFDEEGRLTDTYYTCVNRNCAEYLKPDEAANTQFKTADHEK